MTFKQGDKVKVVRSNYDNASTLIGCSGQTTEDADDGMVVVEIFDDPHPLVGLPPVYAFDLDELELVTDVH
jgi:hypothetical protein